LYTRVNNFNQKISSEIEEVQTKIESNNYSMVGFYSTFFANSKMIFSTMLQDYLRQKNIFENQAYQSFHTDFKATQKSIMTTQSNFKTAEQQEYTRMKSSYFKLLVALSYYEKITFGALNRISFDLKKFQLNETYQSQYNLQLDKFQEMFASVMDLVDQIKQMKVVNKSLYNYINLL